MAKEKKKYTPPQVESLGLPAGGLPTGLTPGCDHGGGFPMTCDSGVSAYEDCFSGTGAAGACKPGPGAGLICNPGDSAGQCPDGNAGVIVAFCMPGAKASTNCNPGGSAVCSAGWTANPPPCVDGIFFW
jgi:hypothetical protein